MVGRQLTPGDAHQPVNGLQILYRKSYKSNNSPNYNVERIPYMGSADWRKRFRKVNAFAPTCMHT